jgi:hypothetical protein
MVGERTRFFIDFASTLFRSINAPLRLVIDEVHNFAPQSKIEKNPDAMKMLHWANRLASEGAGKGLVLLSASQRPQKVHKDYLTCAETLVAMRVIHVLDRTAVKAWIDGAPDQEKGNEVLASLASMARGEGWVWSPEAGYGPARVKFPMFRTYDSFAAPTGQAAKPLKGWAEVDLGEVTKKLAAVVEEAKANDPRELRKRIAELERERKAKAPAAADPRAIEAAEARGEARGRRAVQAELQQAQRALRERDGRLSRIESLAHLNGAAHPIAPATPKATASRESQKQRETRGQTASQVSTSDVGKGELTGPEQRIVNAIAWLESLGIEAPQQVAVAFLAGYSIGGGAFNNPRGSLNTRGLVQYVPGGRIKLTEAGTAVADLPGVALTTSELQARVMDKLPGPERKILSVLLEIYPDDISNEELAERSGYAQGGGAFNNPRGRLRSLGLIDYPSPGRAVACPVLFLEGVR